MKLFILVSIRVWAFNGLVRLDVSIINLSLSMTCIDSIRHRCDVRDMSFITKLDMNIIGYKVMQTYQYWYVSSYKISKKQMKVPQLKVGVAPLRKIWQKHAYNGWDTREEQWKP